MHHPTIQSQATHDPYKMAWLAQKSFTLTKHLKPTPAAAGKQGPKTQRIKILNLQGSSLRTAGCRTAGQFLAYHVPQGSSEHKEDSWGHPLLQDLGQHPPPPCFTLSFLLLSRRGYLSGTNLGA